jgi:ribosomal protein S1
VSLSVRQLTPDPFATLQTGEIVDATISRVVEYGAFALIDGTEIEGLVHISEISDVPGFRPEHLVAPGERVVAKVVAVDPKRRRIGLSIRQAVMIDG